MAAKRKLRAPETVTSTEDVVKELRRQGSNVYYEKSVTKNLGNYESAKVTVGITLPINPTKEERKEIESTIELADEMVTEELEIQLKEITETR